MWSVVVAMSAVSAVVPAGPAYADDVRDAQWHLDALAVAEAHRHTLGAGVTVAVLDSGVDAGHPDLRGAVLPGVDLTGRGPDGRDDPAGTGTALAGLIAGQGHATAPGPGDGAGDAPGPDGVLGLAPAARVLPVVVAEPGAAPAPETLAAGVAEAVRRGADVICLGRAVPDDPAVTQALGAAVTAGVVVVVPGRPAGDALARYGGSGLLAAVAADPTGAVDHAAAALPGAVVVPAAGTTSTGGQGGYYRFGRTGDAAASAVLAGAVALVRAADPGAPGHVAASRITQTAAGGALDLLAALTAPPATPSPAGSPAGPPPEPTAAADTPATEYVAAFDSGDWRRWLVASPLVVFLLLFGVGSVVATWRARGRSRH